MPGTRTAPDATTTPTSRYITLHFIDITGDEKTVGARFPAAATPAQIEAWAVAEQAASSASLYKITNQSEFSSVPDKNNAEADPRSEVENVINRLFKTASGASVTIPLRAPVPDCFISSDSDDPTIGAGSPIPATLTAILALLGAGWEAVSLRYSMRKQQNPSVKL